MTPDNGTQNSTSGGSSHIRTLHSTSRSTVIDTKQACEALGCDIHELVRLLSAGELELYEDSLVDYIDRAWRASERSQP